MRRIGCLLCCRAWDCCGQQAATHLSSGGRCGSVAWTRGFPVNSAKIGLFMVVLAPVPALRNFRCAVSTWQMIRPRPSRYPPSDAIWDGLGLIDFHIVPHYRSPHPESPLMEAVVAYHNAHTQPYRTLADGGVIVVDGANVEVVG